MSIEAEDASEGYVMNTRWQRFGVLTVAMLAGAVLQLTWGLASAAAAVSTTDFDCGYDANVNTFAPVVEITRDGPTSDTRVGVQFALYDGEMSLATLGTGEVGSGVNGTVSIPDGTSASLTPNAGAVFGDGSVGGPALKTDHTYRIRVRTTDFGGGITIDFHDCLTAAASTCTKPSVNVTFAVYRTMDKPVTNDCWTFDRPTKSGGAFAGGWRNGPWTTCGGRDPTKPNSPKSPGYWSFDDTAGFLNDPGLIDDVQRCAKRAAVFAGRKDLSRTVGYMHTAYRTRFRGNSLVPTRSEMRTFRRKVSEKTTLFFQLYDGPDFGCPSFQPTCDGKPIYSEELRDAWSPSSGLVGMLDLGSASPELIETSVSDLCRESRQIGRIGIYAGEGGLVGAKLKAVEEAMNSCTTS